MQPDAEDPGRVKGGLEVSGIIDESVSVVCLEPWHAARHVQDQVCDATAEKCS